MSDTSSSPSLAEAPSTHMLARHLQQQQQQQQQQLPLSNSVPKKDKKKKSKVSSPAVNMLEGTEQLPRQQIGLDLHHAGPQPLTPADITPKSNKKQRKAEAAAAVAAAWGEGGIGSVSVDASPSLLPGSELARRCKKVQVGAAEGAPASSAPSPSAADFEFPISVPSTRGPMENDSPGTPKLGQSASKRKGRKGKTDLAGVGSLRHALVLRF